MPLVRYEVRCEHSLANPELYRSAARDDPEGLLEGVAMAGLVGIVRQLGDLAEFAAEIFRDLHDELMAIGGRGHDLMVRLQQLEAELPVVEKALLSEPNQLRFAYSPGSDWHATIRNDQNHCTQGDLPRFIRHFYEECRGPPRLFLLDKFDVAGAAGACLKRYTDPSFFKLEWANSELMKAQRAQRDKKARREKEVTNLRGKASDLNETQNRYEAVSATNASALVELEDSQVTNMLMQEERQTSREEGTQPTTSADQTSGVNLSEELETTGMGSLPSKHAAREDGGVENVADKISWRNSAEESETVQMTEKLSRHSLKEGGGKSAHMSAETFIYVPSLDANNGAPGKVLRRRLLEIREAANRGGGKFSQQSSIEDGDNFADALTTMGSDESDFEACIQGFLSVDENSEAAQTNRQLNHSILEGHIESARKIPIQAGTPIVEEEPDSMHPLETLSLPHLNSDVAEEPKKHEMGINPSPLHQTSHVSGMVSGGPSHSSISSAESERPMVELNHSLNSHDKEGTPLAGTCARENLDTIPDRRDRSTSDACSGLEVLEVLQVLEVSDVEVEDIFYANPDPGDGSQMLTLKTASPMILSGDSSSSATSSPTIWTPSKSILEPSVSSLSRLSYASSSLMSVSSYSAPSTPSTPRSPVFNVLVSLPKYPLITPQETHDSLWGDFLESPHLNGRTSSYQSDLSSQSPTESPVLSLPPLTSPLPSPPSVPPLEQEDPLPANSRSLAITTPSQAPIIADTGSNLFHSSSLPKLYPLPPNPPGFLEPNLQCTLVNSPSDQEHSLSPVSMANLESADQFPLDARIELRTSQSSKSEMDIRLSLQESTTATSRLGASVRPIAPNPADTKPSGLSSPLPSPRHNVPGPSLVSCEFAVLPAGAPASPGLPSQGSPPGGSRWNFPESSAPSSPTGSVNIKGSPSLPVSPWSNDSHSLKSVPGLDVPPGPHIHSQSSSSAQLDLNAERMEAGKLKFEDGNCAQESPLLETQERILGSLDLAPQKSLGAKIDISEGGSSRWSFDLGTGEIPLERQQSSDPMGPSRSKLHPQISAEVNIPTSSTLTNGVKSPCSSPASYRTDDLHHPSLSPGFLQMSSVPLSASSGTRTILPNQRARVEASFQQRMLPLSGAAHPFSGAEMTTMLSVQNARSESSFQHGSPPDADPLPELQPQELLLPTGDVSSSLQWQGRSKPNPPPKAEFILPPNLPVQSETNSPPHSPPHSVWSESSSQLRWQSRSEPVFPPKLVIPDFSLPPNLAPTPHSPSSSCSPPPSETNSHMESPSPLASPSSPIVKAANFPLEAAVSNNPAGRLQYEPNLEFPSEVNQSPLVRQDALLLSKSSEESLSDLVSSIPVRALSNDDLQGASSRKGLSLLSLEESTSELHPATGPDPETLLQLRDSIPHPSQSIEFSEFTNQEETIDLDNFNLSINSQPSEQNHHRALASKQVLDLIEPPPAAAAATMTTATHPKQSIHPPPPPSAGGFALRKTAETRDALAAAIAAHDRNMLMKVAFKEPVIRPLPLPDERQAILEQIRTKSFNLRHTEKEKKEPVVRPVTNINVAAILEKANAIRQAFAGSDEEDDEDDWSDT
ncbi:unnamed protein product [Sphagnum troendelagicum]|uniref:Protein SCAR n=1 Tax=Sphagnum troendelagicum TaxID=128251 RepID=A0ABP0TP88_9BRYO